MGRCFSMLFALLLAATPAAAAVSQVSGEATLGGRLVEGNGTGSSAKFQEYLDLDDDLVGALKLSAGQDGLHLDVEAENIGLDDQSYRFSGGLYGQFDFSLFYDEMDHNFSFDDHTLYTGVGGNNLTLGSGVVLTDPATWLALDYGVERRTFGGQAEVTLNSPFFVSLDVTQTEKEGVMPWGVNSSSGTGGSYFTELPLPVDHRTTNVTAKAGYRVKNLFASVDGTVSRFENRYDVLNWESPGAFENSVSMSPDNDMWQIGGQLTLRQLPFNSVLALRGSHSRMESDPQLLAAGDFDGHMTYTNASAALRSRPTNKLDTIISYRFLEKNNKAESFDYGGEDTHLFEYSKQNAAVEAGYRLNRNNRIAVGYEFVQVERDEETRFDAEKTDDHIVFAEYKNNSLEFLTAKARYEHLNRSSDFNGWAHVDTLPSSTLMRAYVRPYDAANKDQDQLKLALELAPVDQVDLGVEYNYRKADYEKTVLGRTDEKSQEVIVDAGITLPYKVRFYGYAAYEKAEASSSHMYFPGFAAPSVAPVPDALQGNNGYNWAVERIDKGTSYGLKVAVPLCSDRLRLSAAWDYQRNDGDADYSSTFKDLEDVSAYDDYTQKTLKLKAEFAVTDAVLVTAGYTYDKFRFNDIAINDYELSYGAGASTSYLTGAYAEPDYEASISYLNVTYSF